MGLASAVLGHSSAIEAEDAAPGDFQGEEGKAMKFPLTPAEQAWLTRMTPVVETPRRKKPAADPVPVLSDAEVAWLWPKFQRCRHQLGSFARSFAKTPLKNLTVRGKACLGGVAYVYRGQIFGAEAKKWGAAEFIEAVRRAAR